MVCMKPKTIKRFMTLSSSAVVKCTQSVYHWLKYMPCGICIAGAIHLLRIISKIMTGLDGGRGIAYRTEVFSRAQQLNN